MRRPRFGIRRRLVRLKQIRVVRPKNVRSRLGRLTDIRRVSLKDMRAATVGQRLAATTSATMARPRRTVLLAVLVLGLSAFAASRLDAGAPPSLLADPDSAVATATRSLERNFGAEPIAVVLEADLPTTLNEANLQVLVDLEEQLARLDGVQTVIGPGTFVNQTIQQITGVLTREFAPAAVRADEAANEAIEAAREDGLSRAEQERRGEEARLRSLGPLSEQYEALAERYGAIGVPALTNPNFVNALVIGSAGFPKERFAFIFTDPEHAVIGVRLRSGVSDERTVAIGEEVQGLVDAAPLQGVQTTVGGAPLVVSALTDELEAELPRLAPVALLAMALALLLGLGVRWRSMATLVPAGAAVLLTAAASWLLGLGLTPATIAALPVVLGLTIDYGVQLQARYRSQRAAGVEPHAAARAAAMRVGPVLLLAGGVMVLGFLTLTVSSVPLVDRLGITLAVGVVCGLSTALLLTGPLLVLRDRRPIEAPVLRLPRFGLPRPLRVVLLALAIVLPVAGLALTKQSEVESDIRELAPSGMEEIEQIQALERELGTSGQLRISVRADDVTDPEVLNWMNVFQRRALDRDERLIPGPNLAAILTAGAGAGQLEEADVERLLRLVPPYFVSAVLSRDRTQAEVSFGLPLLPADEQAEVIEELGPLLATAPEGTTAQVGGLIALSASSVSELEDGRPWLLFLAAAVIFAVLLALRRRVDRALVPLLPAFLTAGISSLFVVVTGMKLSPLSAGLEPLVLAVGVEFGLLLEARYHEERAQGRTEAEAATIAGRMVGAPVAVAALTVAAGFAVLGASRLGVLQQFGLLAAGELLLCAVVAILLVPFVASSWERRRKASGRPVSGAGEAQGAPRVIRRRRVLARAGGR